VSAASACIDSDNTKSQRCKVIMVHCSSVIIFKFLHG